MLTESPPPARLPCHPEVNHSGMGWRKGNCRRIRTRIISASPRRHSHLLSCSASPPPCCPEHFPSPTAPPSSSLHLLLQRLTVPEGRGHLRTKWRISRQLCAHTLRWPSIIHLPYPPPHPPHLLHLHSGLFICPHRLHRYTSVAAHRAPSIPGMLSSLSWGSSHLVC